MNISSISFKGGYNRTRTSRPVGTSKFERQPVSDALERTGRKPRTQKGAKKKNTPLKTMLKSFTAGVAATILVNTGAAQLNKPADVITVPYNNSVSITDIAQTYNADLNSILDYNHITEDTDLDEITELQIPTTYDYIQNEIDSLQEKLFDDKLEPEERTELEEMIQQYQAKQELQSHLATVYTDGKYVYFEIKEFDENTPEDIKTRFQYGINVETFKNIFDIKDKAIREENFLDFTWESDAPGGAYKDYTSNNLRPGRTIKVPVNAIKSNNISLDY